MGRQRLIIESVEEVSTVPKGMNDRAHVVFTKSADPDVTPAIEIAALDAGDAAGFFERNKEKIVEIVRSVMAKSDGGKQPDEEGKMSKDKETKVEKLSDEAREALSDEAKAYVEGLEAKVAEGSKAPEGGGEGDPANPEKKGDPEGDPADPKKGADPEDVLNVLKGAAPEIRAAFEAVQKEAKDAKEKAEAAEKIAKAEADARRTIEFEKRAETEIAHLSGTTAEKGKMLRDLYDNLPKETADKVFETLKTADGAFTQLMRAEGRASVGPTDFEARLDAKVAEIRKADPKLSKEKATAKVFEDNPEMYEEYVTETEGR